MKKRSHAHKKTKGAFNFAPMAHELTKGEEEATRNERYRAFLSCPSLFPERLPGGMPVFHTSLDGLSYEATAPKEENDRRFGHIVEGYFAHWVGQHSRYDLLAQNIQVISDGRTLGELDFLIRDNVDGTVWHIELACKFYIWARWKGRWQWIGPNFRDSLQSKLDKMAQQQFPLLHGPAVHNLLQALGIDPAKVAQGACLKGQLFLPVNGTSPKEINPHAFSGRWMTAEEFGHWQPPAARYYIPQKVDWLLPVRETLLKMTHRDVVDYFESSQLGSIMVWMDHDEHPKFRFFLVR